MKMFKASIIVLSVLGLVACKPSVEHREKMNYELIHLKLAHLSPVNIEASMVR